jgi:hypothetical protein
MSIYPENNVITLKPMYALHVPDEHEKIMPADYVIESIKADIATSTPPRRNRILEAIALAAVGSIPWVGGVVSAAAAYKAEAAGIEKDSLLEEWLREHQGKLQQLRITLVGMIARLEGFGKEVEERIMSEEYLTLVRKTFREWDTADTEEKRKLLVNLITNAAGTRLVSDDIVRLFLGWIDSYHESHFAVIRAIYQSHDNPPTRYDIWAAVYGEPIPRDDSAEADLFRMLIRDLSTGGVIRQPRETDFQGRFIRKRVGGARRPAASTMESAFEDSKQYVLTELGSRFVHYTMTELVKQIGSSEPE